MSTYRQDSNYTIIFQQNANHLNPFNPVSFKDIILLLLLLLLVLLLLLQLVLLFLLLLPLLLLLSPLLFY